MKKITSYFVLLIIVFFGLSKNAHAQDAFAMETSYMQDGAPKLAYSANIYGDLDGSPYLFDSWLPGQAKLSDNKIYKGVMLKYDAIQDLLIFKYSATDSAMKFAIQPVEYWLNYTGHSGHYRAGFLPVDGATPNSFYLVLSDGKTQLLKRTVKKIITIHEYNSTVSGRRVEDNNEYYLAKDKKPVHISNNNKAVLKALSDKGDQLSKYITDNKLNAKNDDEFGKIIDYYNTL